MDPTASSAPPFASGEGLGSGIDAAYEPAGGGGGGGEAGGSGGAAGGASASATRDGGGPALHFERNLGRVSAAAEQKELFSFGKDKDKILGQISQIRKNQIDIFRRQMKLEVSLSMDENEDEADNQIFSPEGFSEKFQEKFKRKEKALESIRTMLENLTTNIKEVNSASTDAQMPANPGVDEDMMSGAPATSRSTSRGFPRARPPNKDDAWMGKLELG